LDTQFEREGCVWPVNIFNQIAFRVAKIIERLFLPIKTCQNIETFLGNFFGFEACGKSFVGSAQQYLPETSTGAIAPSTTSAFYWSELRNKNRRFAVA